MNNFITPTVRFLLFANIAVALVQLLFRVPFPELLGLYAFDAPDFRAWQLITYCFVHADEMHIARNMLALYIFAPWVESAIGAKRFATFYLVCAVGAGALNNAGNYAEQALKRQAIERYAEDPSGDRFVQYLETYEPHTYKMNTQECNDFVSKYGKQASITALKELQKKRANQYHVVGASGAVFAVLMAMLLLFPNMRMQFMFFGMAIPNKYLIFLYMAIEVAAVLGVGGQANVAHFVHLAGALMGFLMIKFWKIQKQY